jgi:predicted KAP-like P-loop ATPase
LKSAFDKFASAVGDVPFGPVQAAGRLAAAATRASMTTDVVKLKDELSAELAKQALRIVVIMDDIDRLVADEMRQLFRLIKAVADFPNVTYLLAFDREVAARALEEVHEGRGEQYLEKIVQAPFELPHPDRAQLQALLVRRVAEVLGDIPDGQFDATYWGNVLIDGIYPLVTKPRDIVRLVNGLSVTFPAVKGEVNVVDFVALETLRVLCPAAYDVVRSNQQEFTGAAGAWHYGQEDKTRSRAFHEEWMKALGEQRAPVQRLVTRLFPRLESVWGNIAYGRDWEVQWRRAMRACSPDMFPMYFRFSIPRGAVSNAEFEVAVSDAELPTLADRLRVLADDKRTDGSTRARAMLDRLNDYVLDESSNAVARAPALIRALFDAGDDVVARDEAPSSILDIDDERRVHFAVWNLLKRTPAAERFSLLANGVRGARALGTATREVALLAVAVGRYGTESAQVQEQLLAASEVEQLELLVKERLVAAVDNGGLWTVPHLVTTLSLWRRMGDDGRADVWLGREMANDGRLAVFLEQFLGWSSSSGMTDRVAQRRPHVTLTRVEEFFTLAELVPRLRDLLTKPEWTDTQQTVMRLIVEKYDRRAAGLPRDPMEDFE